MTWAGKRQLLILGSIAIVCIIILFPVVKPVVAPAPTCSDGKQNQGELGADCSGPCQRICLAEAISIKVIWVRSFKVADGVYSVVAYISNPNPGFMVKNAQYIMKLYDERNILVSEREGVIDIPAKETIPIFEGGIQTGESNVKEAFFDFREDLEWFRGSEIPKKVSVGSYTLENTNSPRVLVPIKNTTLDILKNIPVVAIVFDEKDNAIASSQTLIERLEKNQTVEAVFTWSLPFEGKVGPVRIYPRVTD